MKVEFELTKKRTVLIVAIVASCAGAAWAVNNPSARAFASHTVRAIKVAMHGQDAYVKKTLDAQVVATAAPDAPPVIETSRLPIRQKYVALGKGFPAAGGALTRVNAQLVVMSRTGDFYKVENGQLAKLDFGTFPNHLDDYLVHSNAPLTSDALRAHSLSYDETSQRLFVAFTRYVNPNANRYVVASLALDPATLQKKGDWKTEFETEDVSSKYYSQAGGGRVLADHGKLYFSVGYADDTGTGSGPQVPGAQNPKSSFGKIYQMDVAAHQVKMLSMGHRNVQGIAVTADGQLLATEHGPQGGDEINLIREGGNYGWPYRTYGTDYGSYKFDSGFQVPANLATVEPIYAFVPSIAISPIIPLAGFHPEWDGNLLVGSLKAQSLFRVVFKEGRVLISEPIWIGHRIRDMLQLPGQGIVLLTDDSLLVYLTVDEELLKKDVKNAGYNFEPKLQRCLVCHHFEQSTPSSLAPSLAHLLGRKIGGDTGFGRYSDAMRNATGTWDEARLAQYIQNPQSVVPGATMPNLGLSKSEAEDIAKILVK